MKSQKGITMLSLVLYVASFLVVTTTITLISVFFYKNMEIMETSVGSNSQYSRVNLYFLKVCKEEGNTILAWQEDDTSNELEKLNAIEDNKNYKFITFKNVNTAEKVSFIYDKSNKDLYYNAIRICDEVNDFQIDVENTINKKVLKIYIQIDGTGFSTEYVLNS